MDEQPKTSLEGQTVDVVEGIPITYVRGRFTATWNGKQITRAALQSVKNEIKKSLSPISVLQIDRCSSTLSAQTLELMDMSDSGKLRRADGVVLSSYYHVYHRDPELEAELAAANAEHNAVSARIGALIKRFQQVTPQSFAAVRESRRGDLPTAAREARADADGNQGGA